jgi:DNA-binding transcriptional ArsR family regulator
VRAFGSVAERAEPMERNKGMDEGAEPDLDTLFAALADPTRRTVMNRVAGAGPLTASELARHLPVSRQAIARHLAVLREAGLVDSRRVGRETRFTLTPAPLGDLAAWAEDVGQHWDARLARLGHLVTGAASQGPAVGGDDSPPS